MRIFRVLATLLATGLVLGLGFGAQAYTLDQNFGDVDADGSLEITFADTGTDEVTITLSALNLASDEKVSEWYFNYSGDGGATYDASSLTIGSVTGDASTSVTGITLSGAQDMQADGDGQYNILVTFQPNPPTFEGGQSVVIVLTGTDLTADDFAYLSATGGGHGPYYSAAHIQSTGEDNEGSDWVGAVPEPGAMALFSTGLLVAGTLIRRSGRR